MSQKIKTLNGSQATMLKKFLIKINYPKEELVTLLNKELDEFDILIEFEDNIPLAIQKVDIEKLLIPISETISKIYKPISKGQAKALIKRILGEKLTNTERTQLSELRKKIRRYDKFLTYFGEWGKKHDNQLKMIILGLTEEQSDYLSQVLTSPFIVPDRDVIGVNFMTKSIESYGKFLPKLQIWDITNQERFAFLRPQFYRGAAAAFLMFNKESRSSFEMVKKGWISCYLLLNTLEREEDGERIFRD